MATIRDVARKAGVSITTVSATLNSSAAVSKETRERVWAAVDSVGYAPNAFARGLRLGKGRLIGLVVGDITNPFWASMVREVEKVANAAEYSVLISNTDDDEEREHKVLDQLRAQRVAGILLTPLGHGPDYLRRLQRQDMPPIVTLDQRLPDHAHDFVGVDNRAAARMLTEYLLRLGHTRIAVVSGHEGFWTADERMAAAAETIRQAGIEPDPSFLVRTAFRSAAAHEAVQPLLNRPDRPTAIVGGNNVIALGALQAAIDLGFDCPGDISIVGIDDLPWSDLVRPRMTTAVQPTEDIAGIATRWLLERIAGDGPLPPPREKIFQPRFIPGDSCAPAGRATRRQAAELPT